MNGIGFKMLLFRNRLEKSTIDRPTRIRGSENSEIGKYSSIVD